MLHVALTVDSQWLILIILNLKFDRVDITRDRVFNSARSTRRRWRRLLGPVSMYLRLMLLATHGITCYLLLTALRHENLSGHDDPTALQNTSSLVAYRAPWPQPQEEVRPVRGASVDL